MVVSREDSERYRKAARVVVAVACTALMCFTTVTRVQEYLNSGVSREIEPFSYWDDLPALTLCPSHSITEARRKILRSKLCVHHFGANTSSNCYEQLLGRMSAQEIEDLLQWKLEEILVKPYHHNLTHWKMTNFATLRGTLDRCITFEVTKANSDYDGFVLHNFSWYAHPDTVFWGELYVHEKGEHRLLQSGGKFLKRIKIRLNSHDTATIGMTKFLGFQRQGHECSSAKNYSATQCVYDEYCSFLAAHNKCRAANIPCANISVCTLRSEAIDSNEMCAWYLIDSASPRIGCWNPCVERHFHFQDNLELGTVNGVVAFSYRFDARGYELHKDVWSDNTVRLFSDIGGMAGICIGASILSLWDAVVEFLADDRSSESSTGNETEESSPGNSVV